ncbi:Serine/threonine-protein kinase stk11 [Tritrichomonas foetus]|uniref:Serine/threonine-protein kinase stk11 n=1 Tax=Tritrichomonas foetus TaxID=1144522 RepID=A0A1J4JB73_9EUKA|nr:Serine/threonine-protein kinase stk11 [Tritrichomonas foetus]|eukprot:OHS94907.1 Serine/threonine-protein kinase stk11 [Tritrichomonas foetus]
MLSDFYGKDPFIHQLDSSSFEEEEEKPMKKVNQYLLLQTLGEGSFAKVFLALDTHTQKYYAMKRFKLRDLQHIDAGVSQLEREISAMRKIVHPNIIHLHDVLHVEDSDIVYLVIDYADCGSLQQILESPIPPNDSIIKYVFYSILNAVSYLHSHGIVHQDIKPSNILLCSDGNVYLSDFGVGHSFQSAAMVVGSPGYQAPEALCDFDLDPDTLNPAKEDVWSLGVTLYQVLFNDLPFKGENVYEIVQNVTHNPLIIPEGTDEEIADLLHGMLNVMPGGRMDVEDVMRSPFFDDIVIFSHLNFDVIKPPKVSSDVKIENITARVCDTHYSFARPNLTAEELIKTITIVTPVEFQEFATEKSQTHKTYVNL